LTDPTDTEREPPRRSPGYNPAWYLVFLGFLFLTPAFNPEGGVRDWALAGGIAALTAVAYMMATRNRRYRLPVAAFLMVLALAGTILPTSAMGVLPIFAAALVATVGTRRQLIGRLAGITIVTLASMPLAQIPMPYLLLVYAPALLMIWLVGLSVFDDVNRNVETERLRAENARIEYLATVTERERIARDLHDLAGQALTAVTLRSELVQRLADKDPERVRSEAAAIEQTARETLAALRETVAGWRQIELADELVKGEDALRAAGVAVVVSGDWKQDLAPSVETVVALALREGITNVVRHARASRCEIELESLDGQLTLTMSDDGIGIARPEGSGLRGMRERVGAAGGKVQIEKHDPGTMLRVTMPVATP